MPRTVALLCYIQYAVLAVFGRLRDLCGDLFGGSRYAQRTRKGYGKLFVAFENFYTKRFFHRVHDIYHRPLAGPPGR